MIYVFHTGPSSITEGCSLCICSVMISPVFLLLLDMVVVVVELGIHSVCYVITFEPDIEKQTVTRNYTEIGHWDYNPFLNQ